LSKDVKGEEHVDEGVPRNHPFVAAGEDRHLGSVFGSGELERLNSAGATPNNGQFLASRILAAEELAFPEPSGN
jgi:hypothetical protein